MNTFKIAEMEFHKRSGVGIGGRWEDRPLYVARVITSDGASLSFSRYPDEDAWYCDAFFGGEGLPHWCHGEGSRCCAKHAAAGELEAELNRRMAALPRKPIDVLGVV